MEREEAKMRIKQMVEFRNTLIGPHPVWLQPVLDQLRSVAFDENGIDDAAFSQPYEDTSVMMSKHGQWARWTPPNGGGRRDINWVWTDTLDEACLGPSADWENTNLWAGSNKIMTAARLLIKTRILLNV